MKSLYQYIQERKNDPIDNEWINSENPVQTKDGRQAIITKYDIEDIPNIIYGAVKMNGKLFDYQWLEDGTCKKALDRLGNPKQPNDSDTLVKVS